MKFFLDHDVPSEVARVLRQEGYEVVELRSVLPMNTTDPEVYRYANAGELFLITCNRDDFLTLASAEPTHGLIVLIRRRNRMTECGELLRLLQRAGESGLRGNINCA